jgi:hypothetical protein
MFGGCEPSLGVLTMVAVLPDKRFGFGLGDIMCLVVDFTKQLADLHAQEARGDLGPVRVGVG